MHGGSTSKIGYPTCSTLSSMNRCPQWAVQQQNGRSDCALFAIAFCLSLVLKQDTASLRWRQGKMKKHLINILRTEQVAQFFTAQNRIKANIQNGPTHITIELWCVCLLPGRPCFQKYGGVPNLQTVVP